MIPVPLAVPDVRPRTRVTSAEWSEEDDDDEDDEFYRKV